MKNILLIHLLMLNFLYGSAQWKPYRVDDSVQVSLPAQYKRTDTLGQSVISAATQFGNVIVIKTPDNPSRTPDIEKERHLKAFYENYLKKVRSSAKEGTISDERDTMIRNLKYKDFTLQVDSGSGKQFRNFRIVHVNNATYTFEFLYQDIHKEYAKEDSAQFFNGIRIPPDADLASQFTKPGATTGEPPSSNRMLIIGGSMLGILLLIIISVALTRRKRRLRNM